MAQLLLNMENTAEVPRDEKLAMKVLKAASDKGDADAAFLLARHLLQTPDADHVEAMELLKHAAEPPRVHHISAHTLGQLYLGESKGVTKDLQTALSWWKVAGQNGFPPAMGNVGAF